MNLTINTIDFEDITKNNSNDFDKLSKSQLNQKKKKKSLFFQILIMVSIEINEE